MPPIVTPTSTHINHTATTSDNNRTLNQLVEDDSCKQGTPEAIVNSERDCKSKLSLQSSETVAVSEQKCPGVIDEDLLLGLCPEDLLNCSTSFCVSLNDSTSIGHVKGETFPDEVKTPSIQSPNYPFTCSNVSLHSTPVHSTPKPSTHKQSTDNVPAIGLESTANSEAPTYVSRNQSSIPSNTFYGLPLKVKQCLEEHRGITKLYGNQHV